MDWILVIGIAMIVAVAVTLIVFLVRGVKKGFLSTVINFGISVASFVVSFLLAKPILWLFDKIYKFSMTYFDKFALAFSKIPVMNELIHNQGELNAQIAKFQSTDVVMSPWIKDFLVKIFNNTSLESTYATTLGTIAANAMSYIIMMLLVTLSLFMTIKIVIYMFASKLDKIKRKGKALSKLGGALFGMLHGAFFVLIAIALVSVTPLGTDDKTISDSVERTKVLTPMFSVSQTLTTNYYSTKVNWTEQNNNFTKLNSAMYATFTNSKPGKEHRYIVKIKIDYNNQLKETITEVETSSVLPVKEYSYVYANGKLWVFEKITESGEDKWVFVMTIGVDSKNKTIHYEKMMPDEENYSRTLVQVS